MRLRLGLLILVVLLCGLAAAAGGCVPPPVAEEIAATDMPPTATAAADEPTATAGAAETPPGDLPPAVLYDLGEATVIQSNFPEDSRFRNMPVRLNGVIAVPEGDGGPYPVAVFLHGTHPGCPTTDAAGSVDTWPCALEDEQPNYQGFEYLVRELADRGYVALSLNINAENTFGFGEPVAFERLSQLVDLQMTALAEAAAGGENGFGVDLARVADVSKLVFMGHSRGGEAAGELVEVLDLATPEDAAERGYGPVAGVLMVAPAVASTKTPTTAVPLAAILPACDGDVIAQDGQWFYERVRFSDDNPAATTLFLDAANHNAFNSILGPDMMGSGGRAECETLLDPDVQRAFLVDYAADFMTAVLGEDEAAAAAGRLGLDAAALADGEHFGLPSRVAVLNPAADRLLIFGPLSADEMTTNRSGGSVTAEGVETQFCEEGYSTPFVNPGSEACVRPNVTIPAYPAMAPVAWEGPGATLRFALPKGGADLSDYASLSLRMAVNPVSDLNTPGEPGAFSVRLTDASGATATVTSRSDEPALQFPAGAVQDDETFGVIFDGRAFMATMRIPLSDFEGVDLAAITEVALVFDQTPTGALFLADVEAVGPPIR
jgi:hypothetical protein